MHNYGEEEGPHAWLFMTISSIAYKESTWEMKKARKGYENEIVVMSPYILWEQVSEFINGQGWGKKKVCNGAFQRA